LIAHFQCNLCVFRNLQKQSPTPCKPMDNLLMCCIRQSNLDALWSREWSTVTLNVRSIQKGLKLSSHMDLCDPYELSVMMPVADITGHRAAIQMLLYSLEEGKY
jgi:hypothetical protein